jgi:hypothetical protein
MIAAARSRAKDAGVTPDFHQTFGESYFSQEKFDAAICLFTTLGQINNEGENSQLIERVGNLLNISGYFILEIPQREWIVSNLKAHERIGDSSTYTDITRSYEPDNNIVTEIFEVHSLKRATSFLLQYRVYSFIEIQKLLSESGLSVIATFGDYSQIALHIDDPIMLMIAQNQV